MVWGWQVPQWIRFESALEHAFCQLVSSLPCDRAVLRYLSDGSLAQLNMLSVSVPQAHECMPHVLNRALEAYY